jgi:transcriptional regulator with XRE-family HTH domain
MDDLRLQVGEVADQLKVSRQTVTNWRSGKGEPGDLARMEALASVLGVSAGWLATGEGERGLRSHREREGSQPGTYAASADPVEEVVRDGQDEQAAWVREFAARVLEAQAARIRTGGTASRELRKAIDLAQAALSSADIDADIRAAEDLERKVTQGRATTPQPATQKKRARKPA